ncbi:hypothetical protein JST97_37330 [bacterium]|nr:hypothetical protein [bacterium]
MRKPVYLLWLLLPFLLAGFFRSQSSQRLMGSWLAHPEKYDYLQAVTFRPDGTGDLVWGDHQVIRHDEKFQFDLRPLAFSPDPTRWSQELASQRFELRFLSEQGREYSGRLLLEEGHFQFEREGPVGGRVSYACRLTFDTCPFGFLECRQYYGHEKK